MNAVNGAVGVIGAGTMGVGISYVFAAAGFETFVVEPDDERAGALLQVVTEQAGAGLARGKLSAAQAAALPLAVRRVGSIGELPSGIEGLPDVPGGAVPHARRRPRPDRQHLSTAALGNVGQANYSAAKAGLQGLTRTLALEMGRDQITVNAVAPGFTITDMTRGTAERVGVDFDVMVAEQVAQIPVGRAGEPADITHAVAFFADPRSGFVSGQVLYVAGGPRS